MPQTVLLTGATGTIGLRLVAFLHEAGFSVSILSRSVQSLPNVTTYNWDIGREYIDPQAIATADHIIHLAGAGIADERWSEARKKEILDSRVRSTNLIVNALRTTQHQVKSFVCSSAIGYYGGNTGDRMLTETDPAGTDFLATVTRAWEASAEKVATLGIRTVRMRTGVVLTMAGGALPKLAQPIRFNAGAPIGTGQQYISWIHLDDLCRLYVRAVQDERWAGAYNGVAPGPVTNERLTRQIATVLDKAIILPNIPAFTIRLAFGELAVTVLGSSRVGNARIVTETDFLYRFSDLNHALTDLLR
jgi:uncharacterized protein